LVSTRKYDVYGVGRGSTGPTGTKHKFVGGLGHPSEDETGLIYMRARYMDPVTGRFISEDPAKDGGNWFEYADSSPTNRVDATGKFSLSNLSLGVWAMEVLFAAGLDAGLQYVMTGAVNWEEVYLAACFAAAGGAIGHVGRFLHYSKSPVMRRTWVEAHGSFSVYFRKFIGLGAGSSAGRGKMLPMWRALASGAGARVFAAAYNLFLAGYMDDELE
jgi:RHS repeat-associated protein